MTLHACFASGQDVPHQYWGYAMLVTPVTICWTRASKSAGLGKRVEKSRLACPAERTASARAFSSGHWHWLCTCRTMAGDCHSHSSPNAHPCSRSTPMLSARTTACCSAWRLLRNGPEAGQSNLVTGQNCAKTECFRTRKPLYLLANVVRSIHGSKTVQTTRS